jgi:diguanylate cyclase (GGDEF)-like protein
MKKGLSLFVLLCFLVTGTMGQAPVFAQDFYLPAPGVMVRLSPEFNPPVLKGIKVHPDNPFRFDFILDKGDGVIANAQLKEESKKLIKYFLASLTIPEKDLWVNLSPYEKDRIIPNSFGLTEMGRDLLAEDYMLKQITASLIYPEDAVGRKFWRRIYEEAAKKYETTNIPISTFNKVWIIPDKAVVYENAKASTAYVVESRLKVMLEQDYLSLQKHTSGTANDTDTAASKALIPDTRSRSQVSLLGANIVREIVIPELTKEVNENKNFSHLRQVYNSLILATWYKKKIKDSILTQVYADKSRVAGINIDDPQEKEKIYQNYLRAFKKGVFNYIKEEQDPLTQETTPRKYFSGGENFTNLSDLAMTTLDHIDNARLGHENNLVEVSGQFGTADQSGKGSSPAGDRAMAGNGHGNGDANGSFVGGLQEKFSIPSYFIVRLNGHRQLLMVDRVSTQKILTTEEARRLDWSGVSADQIISLGTDKNYVTYAARIVPNLADEQQNIEVVLSALKTLGLDRLRIAFRRAGLDNKQAEKIVLEIEILRESYPKAFTNIENFRGVASWIDNELMKLSVKDQLIQAMETKPRAMAGCIVGVSNSDRHVLATGVNQDYKNTNLINILTDLVMTKAPKEAPGKQSHAQALGLMFPANWYGGIFNRRIDLENAKKTDEPWLDGFREMLSHRGLQLGEPIRSGGTNEVFKVYDNKGGVFALRIHNPTDETLKYFDTEDNLRNRATNGVKANWKVTGMWRHPEKTPLDRPRPHPVLTSTYEAGQVNGVPYILMDFMDGFPVEDIRVRDAIDSHQAPVSWTLLTVPLQLAAAFIYFNKFNLQLRDPNLMRNVLIGKDQGVSFIDFDDVSVNPEEVTPQQMEFELSYAAMASVGYLLDNSYLKFWQHWDPTTDGLLEKEITRENGLAPQENISVVKGLAEVLRKMVKHEYGSFETVFTDLARAGLESVAGAELPKQISLEETFETMLQMNRQIHAGGNWSTVMLKGGKLGGLNPEIRSIIVKKFSEDFEVFEGSINPIGPKEVLARWSLPLLKFISGLKGHVEDRLLQEGMGAIYEEDWDTFESWMNRVRVALPHNSTVHMLDLFLNYALRNAQQLLLQRKVDRKQVLEHYGFTLEEFRGLLDGKDPLAVDEQDFVKALIGKTFEPEKRTIRGGVLIPLLKPEGKLNYLVDLLRQGGLSDEQVIRTANGVHVPSSGELRLEWKAMQQHDLALFIWKALNWMYNDRQAIDSKRNDSAQLSKAINSALSYDNNKSYGVAAYLKEVAAAVRGIPQNPHQTPDEIAAGVSNQVWGPVLDKLQAAVRDSSKFPKIYEQWNTQVFSTMIKMIDLSLKTRGWVTLSSVRRVLDKAYGFDSRLPAVRYALEHAQKFYLLNTFDSGKPSVVFIHGGGASNSAKSFVQIFKNLQNKFNVAFFEYDNLRPVDTTAALFNSQWEDFLKNHDVKTPLGVVGYANGTLVFRYAVLTGPKESFQGVYLSEIAPPLAGSMKTLPMATPVLGKLILLPYWPERYLIQANFPYGNIQRDVVLDADRFNSIIEKRQIIFLKGDTHNPQPGQKINPLVRQNFEKLRQKAGESTVPNALHITAPEESREVVNKVSQFLQEMAPTRDAAMSVQEKTMDKYWNEERGIGVVPVNFQDFFDAGIGKIEQLKAVDAIQSHKVIKLWNFSFQDSSVPFGNFADILLSHFQNIFPPEWNTAYAVKELLKNAYYHGNKMRNDAPIYLFVNQDKSVEVFDLGLKTGTEQYRRIYGTANEFGGRGKAFLKIKQDGWLTPQPVVFSDLFGRPLGVKAAMHRDSAMIAKAIQERLEGAEKYHQKALLTYGSAAEKQLIVQNLSRPYFELTQENFSSLPGAGEEIILAPSGLKFTDGLQAKDFVNGIRLPTIGKPVFETIEDVYISQGRYLSQPVNDYLTGALNRAGFISSRNVVRAIRDKGYMAILDIDHFKAVNELFGHDVGDRVLRSFAGSVQSSTRPGDIMARWGGEEFVLLMPAAQQPQGDIPKQIHQTILKGVYHSISGRDELIRKLQSAVAANNTAVYKALIFQLSLQNGQEPAILEKELPTLKEAVEAVASPESPYKLDGWFLTFSMGAVWFDETGKAISGIEDRIKGLVSQADENLLLAKGNGKNRVVSGIYKDQAMHTNTGGIDLTPANMTVQMQNDGGQIKFHLDPVLLKQLRNASGFVPVSITIRPVTNLRAFLGLAGG